MARRRASRSRGRSTRRTSGRRSTARRSFRGRSAGRTRSVRSGARRTGRTRGQTVRIEIVQPAANPLGRFLPGVAPGGQMAVATGPKTAKF